MAEPLIGPQPIIGTGDKPDVIGGNAPTTEYAPMNEAARQAIFGVNPTTGKAYTNAESAAANAGYNPYAGAVGYQIDPRSGNLNILLDNGSVMTTGATYQTTSQGAIVPSDAYMQNFNKRLVESGQAPIAFDEYGVQVTINPSGTTLDSKGKPMTIVYDGSGNPKGSPAAFVANNVATGTSTGGNLGNPYTPGTQQYTDFNERKSAYDILFQEFNRYGLGTMVEPLKSLITEGVSPSEFGLRLTQTDAYKKRFAANQDRINKGLRSLTPAEYVGLEDQYQSLMRNYGLPASYYTKGDLGAQEGFNKLISNDVSAAELEDRIATAQKRVINADPAVTDALRQFYPDITNADILAYTLDPTNALENIKRKVTAAEIGGAALAQDLGTSASRAEELAKYGITKAQAQQGYGTIAEFLPTAEKLGDIYSKQGMGAYDQATAEQEVFGTAGAAEAAKKRKRLTQLEQAQFGGQSGTSQGALDRGRQGSF